MDLTFCQFSQVDILKSGNVVPNSVFFFFFLFSLFVFPYSNNMETGICI